GVTIKKALYLNQNIQIDGSTTCTGNLQAPNIYTKSQIDTLLITKQDANPGTLTINTLTTTGPILKLLSDTILFNSKSNVNYLTASSLEFTVFTDLFVDGIMKNRNGLSIGDFVSNTWTPRCTISSTTGNIVTTSGSVTVRPACLNL
ncbi:MAG: hypothetical protein ACKPKO_51720, partial [Candidatus Fonsibacter sp.]